MTKIEDAVSTQLNTTNLTKNEIAICTAEKTNPEDSVCTIPNTKIEIKTERVAHNIEETNTPINAICTIRKTKLQYIVYQEK